MSTSLAPTRRRRTPGEAAQGPSEHEPHVRARAARALLWMLGGLFMALLLAIVVGVTLVIAANDGIDVSDGAAATQIETSSGTEPATTASAGNEVTPGIVANRFAAAWSAGDWTTVAELSNESVVAVAHEWYVEGVEVTVVRTSLQEQGGEMLVVDPTFTPGLIFGFLLNGEGSDLHVGELFFNGDAG